jgi:serine/threonine protein kinase
MKRKALTYDNALHSYVLLSNIGHRYVITSNDVRYNVGDGSYGKVFKSKSLEDGCTYAVKQITKTSEIPDATIKEEIAKLKEFKQFQETPNVIYAIDSAEDDKFFYIVMPFCDHGKLTRLIEENKIIDEVDALELFRQICFSAKLLKDNGISAMNVDINNILLQENHNAQPSKYCLILSDLGIIKSTINSTPKFDDDVSCSVQYKSMESFDEDKAEVFHLGTILYYLVTGEEFSQENSEVNASKANHSVQIKTHFPTPLSCFTMSILEGCLQFITEKRIAIHTLFLKLDVYNYYKSHKAIQIDCADQSQKLHLSEFKRGMKRTSILVIRKLISNKEHRYDFVLL